MTPQVGNKTRHTDDYENEIEAGKHNVKSPYPLVYDHEDNDSKELEQYESIIGITETKTESGRNAVQGILFLIL